MRVWVDLTNSPHVLVMRLIQAMREDGHEVEVTARLRADARALRAARARRGLALPPLRELALPQGARALHRARSAVDAQSLIALADLVISAGGTMNREAVALGTPVFTTFEGRLGAVDEALLDEGRLRKLEDPDQIRVAKRPQVERERVWRDPRALMKLPLSANEG